MPLSRVPDFEAARGSCTFRVHDVTPRQSLAVLMTSGTRMRRDLVLQKESWACQYGPLGLGGRKPGCPSVSGRGCGRRGCGWGRLQV